MIYTPSDNKQQTKKYLKLGYGICGHACLAVITKTTIKEVLKEWKKQKLPFKSGTNYYLLKDYLINLGYKVKRVNKISDIKKSYIARVQWIGGNANKEKPLYGWNYWVEASCNTHFIVFEGNSFFCNETGEHPHSEILNYLSTNNGVITSYLEVEK